MWLRSLSSYGKRFPGLEVSRRKVRARNRLQSPLHARLCVHAANQGILLVSCAEDSEEDPSRTDASAGGGGVNNPPTAGIACIELVPVKDTK